MQKPLISIVMPAYNHERFVGPAIEGVLNQTLKDFELVIVDDGSTDGTAAVIKGYDDSRIHYHFQENQDAYNALNKGMSLARGDYISILNSDDVYHPERLARCLAAAKEGAEAVFTAVEPIDDAGNLIPEGTHYWHVWNARNVNHFLKTGDLYAGFLRGNLMITTSNLFMTAHAAQTTGDFASLRYLHDYDYIFRLLLAFPGKCNFLHGEKLLKYRIHGANTLKQGAIKAREEDLLVIRKYMLAGLPPSAAARAQTGLDRILELQRELVDVRRRLRWGRWLPLVEKFIRFFGRSRA
ncbi:MAG TPA: glycosyltransferase [Kiritimatiellia bacterium]|nr:glycosyltransferase [Kiritimatiellia bacterium]